MALLVYFFCFLALTQPAEASFPAENVSRSVLFDSGRPQNSVGVIGQQFVEVGDDFEHYQVAGFEPRVILLKDHRTAEVIKIPAEDRLSPSMTRKMRHRFVVRQLRAIFEAQVAYIAKYQDHYASSLETLIHEELLADGFSQGIKQDYFFYITESKAEFNREPTFFVIATPVKSIQSDSFFSVDQLGLIRYAETLVHLPWGPAWDYEHHYPAQSAYIGTEKQKKSKE